MDYQPAKQYSRMMKNLEELSQILVVVGISTSQEQILAVAKIPRSDRKKNIHKKFFTLANVSRKLNNHGPHTLEGNH